MRPTGRWRRPPATGYTFAGWFTAAYRGNAGDIRHDRNDRRESHALRAVDGQRYTGDVRRARRDDAGPAPASQVTYDATYGTLATTTREGYTFAGWFTSGYRGTQVTSGTTVTTAANHTLYAQWTANATR